MASLRSWLAALPLRVEPGLEQPDQQPGDRGVGAQHALDVVLAEGRARLAQVLGVGAQHGRPARQVRCASRTRALNPSSSITPCHSAASAPSTCSRTCSIRHPRGRGLGRAAAQPEVVDPERLGGRELVRVLVDHVHAHVLQPRQHVGQRDRAAGAVDRQPPDPLGPVSAETAPSAGLDRHAADVVLATPTARTRRRRPTPAAPGSWPGRRGRARRARRSCRSPGSRRRPCASSCPAALRRRRSAAPRRPGRRPRTGPRRPPPAPARRCPCRAATGRARPGPRRAAGPPATRRPARCSPPGMQFRPRCRISWTRSRTWVV